MSSIRAIRGAISAENTKASIETATVELISKIIKENSIALEDICHVIFSVTADINADFPAKYARIRCGFDHIPMMCFQEMSVEGSMKSCIRILMVVNSDKQNNAFKHQYLREAAQLRPDLAPPQQPQEGEQ